MLYVLITLSIALSLSAVLCWRYACWPTSSADPYLRFSGTMTIIVSFATACALISTIIATEMTSFWSELLIVFIVSSSFFFIGKKFHQDGFRLTFFTAAIFIYLFADGISFIWENHNFYLLTWFYALTFYLGGSWLRELEFPKLPVTTG